VTAFLARLKRTRPGPATISGEDAAASIVAAPFEPYSIVGFDNREAARIGLNAGDIVTIAPDDTGQWPLSSYKTDFFE
jgi:hypothetical protein